MYELKTKDSSNTAEELIILTSNSVCRTLLHSPIQPLTFGFISGVQRSPLVLTDWLVRSFTLSKSPFWIAHFSSSMTKRNKNDHKLWWRRQNQTLQERLSQTWRMPLSRLRAAFYTQGPFRSFVNYPPLGNPRGISIFDFWRSNSRHPVPRICSNAPHVGPALMGKCPNPGHYFYHLTGQNRFKTICYKWQLADWIKEPSYLHLKASQSFYGPFLASHSVTNAISCPLNRLSFSLRSLCTNGQIPHLLRLGVKFPTPASVLKSNSLLPGKGRLSNARGMPRLHIDRCIIFFTAKSNIFTSFFYYFPIVS